MTYSCLVLSVRCLGYLWKGCHQCQGETSAAWKATLEHFLLHQSRCLDFFWSCLENRSCSSAITAIQTNLAINISAGSKKSVVFHWECLLNQCLLTIPKHWWVEALQRKGCSPYKHSPPDLEGFCLFPALLKTYGEYYGHLPLPVSQKGWFAHLEWSSCTGDYYWYRSGVPVVVPHVVVAGLLVSQMIVQGTHAAPFQVIWWIFPNFLTQGNYFYPLLLAVNESRSSNLQIQFEHQTKTSW